MILITVSEGKERLVLNVSSVSNVLSLSVKSKFAFTEEKNQNMERHHKQKATESDCKAGNTDETRIVVKFVKGMCSRLQLNVSVSRNLR